MSQHPTIAIVGSGPIGSAYARVLVEQSPRRARRDVRGRPAADPDPRRERAQHRRSRREGARARDVAGTAGGCAARIARHPGQCGRRGHVHRPPGHAPDRLRWRRAPAHAPDASRRRRRRRTSAAWGRTGRARLPSPAFSEKIPFIADDEWDDLLATAKDLLHVQSAAFADSAVGEGIRVAARGGVRRRAARRLRAEHASRSPATRSPTARCAGPVPTSCSARSSTPHRRSARGSSCTTSSLVRRVEVEDGRATGVTVEDLRTRETRVRAGRPGGRGRRRVPLSAAAVGLRHPSHGARALPHRASRRDLDRRARCRTRSAASPPRTTSTPRSHVASVNPADPVAAVNRIPFSEPDHPFSLQVMYAENPPFQLDPSHPAAGNRWGYVNMGYGMRKRPALRGRRHLLRR